MTKKDPGPEDTIKDAFPGATVTEIAPEPPPITIRLERGELGRILDAIDSALAGFPARHDLYQRGGQVVHPVETPVAAADGRQTSSIRLLPAAVPYVVEMFGRVAKFEKWDARKNEYVACDCSKWIAEAWLARGKWNLRVLARVVSAPIMRLDGSVLDQPGYDERTRLLFEPGGPMTFAWRPSATSRADALEALQYLKSLLRTFAFVSPADLSVALCAILTAIERPCLRSAPIICFTAPVAGSGKSYIVDLACMAATGRPAPVIAQGRSEEEAEKRLGSLAIEGSAIGSIDNCERALGGALLCQLLTQDSAKIRVLGLSLSVEVPCNTAWFGTGNNLVPAGDITRRALLGSLDPLCERPELRTFDSDPLAALRADRGKYVAAAITVMRAHALSGWKDGPPPIGSFVEWSRVVRNPLIWLGEADPCETMVKVRESDPRLTVLSSVLYHWENVIAESGVTSAEIIDHATARGQVDGREQFLHPEFREALLQVAGESGAINTRRLGWWLTKIEGRMVEGRRIVRAAVRNHAMVWQLELVERGD